MKCKILEIGPDDYCRGDIDKLRNVKGALKRSGRAPHEWLSGEFVPDKAIILYPFPLFFFQVRIQPMGVWPK